MDDALHIPEWCLLGCIAEPTSEQIAATIDYINTNPDIAACSTVIEDAAISLIARDGGGNRFWNDSDIAMLGKRQRDVVTRIIDNGKPVSLSVIDAIKAGITPAEKEVQDVTVDKRANPKRS